MHRRHFVKLSAATTATVLFSRLTSLGASSAPVINSPEEVWAQSGKDWFQLKPSNGAIYTYKNIQVSLKPAGNALAVYAQSPDMELNAVRLKWKHTLDASTKCLGDHWERSYGDLSWKSPDASPKNPWYVILNDNKHAACFGVKTGCNSICWWAVKLDALELTLDTQAGGVGVQLGSRELHAADIVTTKSTDEERPFTTTHRFCKMMCEKPRLPKKPVYGINDWYFAYGNNSAELIKQITGLMTDLATNTDNRPFSVIDAGWATYSPFLPGDGGFQEDFAKPNDKFKDMAVMADEIKKLGMQPGLWTRPLCARHDEKASLLLPSIPGRDDPHQPILDPTIAENVERVKYNIDTYKKWGYNLVKHDYTTYDIMGRWGFNMTNELTTPGWKFNDSSRTTAEVINHLYQVIREKAGDMYVIGCNTMSHLSAGVFEMNRIGDDTSGKEWDRTRKMGVNTLGFRIPQHNAFYAADADCVGLTTDIPWTKNKQWLQLVAESSTPLFISPQPNAIGEEQKKFIRHCYAIAAKPQPIGEPIDWMTNNRPDKWMLNERVVGFNWG